MDTSAQRAQARQRRRGLSAKEQITASALLAIRLRNMEEFRAASLVSAYAASDGEVQLDPFIVWLWNAGICVTFPVIDADENLRFVPSRAQEPLAKGRFGIAVPAQALTSEGNLKPGLETADARDHDIILVPGVLFGPNGARVGRGRGYYDRALRPLGGRRKAGSPAVIGVGHEFQWTPDLRPQSEDVPVEAFASPYCLRRFGLPTTPWQHEQPQLPGMTQPANSAEQAAGRH